MRKIALVTGGTRGIGRAISLKLARSGFKVLALYGRNREAADSLTAEAQKEDLQILCLRGDLTRDASFEQILSQIKSEAPQIDCLVHSAASGVHRDAMDLTLKHLRFTFEINVFSIHNLITHLIDRLPSGARIIAVTSSGGTRVIPHYAAVGSSKGALESLFRHYAKELAPSGIAVNLVCPGLVMTDAVDAFVDGEKRVEHSLQKTPTGHLTTVEEVAGVVDFLATSSSAAQIQGQTIVIDGGMTLTT
jgi:enoyl-[acyl-carrier protein] reductase III